MGRHCMLCGDIAVGYIEVRDEKDEIVGRICSKHSFKEVVLDQKERFGVRVIYSPLEKEEK